MKVFLSTIVQGGFSLAVTQPDANFVFGASDQMPKATSILPRASGSTDERIGGWLNPAAFARAPVFTFGNISRFLDVRGPAFGNPNTTLTNNQLGTITAQINNPRLVSLARGLRSNPWTPFL